jgi:hypothetical protein
MGTSPDTQMLENASLPMPDRTDVLAASRPYLIGPFDASCWLWSALAHGGRRYRGGFYSFDRFHLMCRNNNVIENPGINPICLHDVSITFWC